jgi:hypothetical protein
MRVALRAVKGAKVEAASRRFPGWGVMELGSDGVGEWWNQWMRVNPTIEAGPGLPLEDQLAGW